MLKTTSFFVSALIMLLFLIIPKHFVAQPQQVAVGDKLRINAPPIDTGRIVGVVEEISNIGILLSTRDGMITIPYNTIQGIQASVGQKSRWKLGYLLGSFTGAAIGSLFAEKSKCDARNDRCLDFTEWENISKVSTGMLIGMLVGTGIGLTIKADRWKKVSLDISPETAVALHDHSLKPAISVKFSLKSQ